MSNLLDVHVGLLEENNNMFTHLVGNNADYLQRIDFEKNEEELERLGGEQERFTNSEDDVEEESHEELMNTIKDTLEDIWDEDLVKVVKANGSWLFSKFFALKLNRRNVVRIHFNVECNPAASAVITIMLFQMGLKYVLVSPCYEVLENGDTDFGFRHNYQRVPLIVVPSYEVQELDAVEPTAEEEDATN